MEVSLRKLNSHCKALDPSEIASTGLGRRSNKLGPKDRSVVRVGIKLKIGE